MERTYTTNKVSYFFEKLAGRTKDDTLYHELLDKVKFLRKIKKQMILIPKDQVPPENSTEFYRTENKIWYII